MDSSNPVRYADRLRYLNSFSADYFSNNDEVMLNARSDIDKYISLNGTEGFVYRLKGQLVKTDDKQKAIEYYTKAIEYGDTAYSSRALCYFFLNDYKRAAADYEMSNKNNQNSSQIYYEAICNVVMMKYLKAGDLFIRSKDYYSGIKQYLVSDNINKAYQYKDSVNGYLLAVIYYKMRQYDIAKKVLLSTLKIDSINYNSEYLLGKVYLRINDKKNAISHLEQSFIKGFRFFDLLAQDLDYKEIAQIKEYQYLVKKYQLNDAGNTLKRLKNVYDRKVPASEEGELLYNRENILILDSSQSMEFNQLITVTFDEYDF